MADEHRTLSPLAEGDAVCGDYVLGPIARLGAWVSVFFAKREGEDHFGYEARVVHVEPSDHPASAAALAREAGVLTELRHPSIPRVVAVGVERGEPMIISERAPGRTLRDLAAEGRADLALALRVVSGVVGALDSLHGRDPPVVHRRVSPEVIVVHDDHVWLEECGLVHVLTRAGWLPEDISTVAPEYLTPEELQRHASPRSDVFALATVVFEALTGTAPFAAETDAERSLAILSSPRMSASAVRPDVLPELDAVFHRAWARDPRDGMTATEFASAFENALEAAAQRIARERADGHEPVARLTPMHGQRSATTSTSVSVSSPKPTAITTRPPPLPRGTTRLQGSEGSARVSATPSPRPAARSRPPIASPETPLEMASAVRTLPPSGMVSSDDPDVTLRRVAAITRDDSVSGPAPVAARSSTPPASEASATKSATSSRPPERSEADRPTLPPRARVTPEPSEPLTSAVTVKAQPMLGTQAARTLGVAIVAAAAIIAFAQVYIARMSNAPEVTPSHLALRSSAPPAIVPPAVAPPAALPTSTPEVRAPEPTPPIATPPIATPPIAPPTIATPPIATPPVTTPPVATPRPTVTLPARPSVAELARVRVQLESAVQRCVSSEVGPLVQLAATYAGRTGRATRVDISGRANQEPMGACIESAVMRWPLAPFSAPTWRVEYGVPIGRP